ncbi:MAG: hypothetical protein ACRD0J_09935 [Acidimicrobiales bacterium]
MPRTVDEILAHADELAKRFENDDLGPGASRDATPIRELHRAVEDAALAQKRLRDAVTVARSYGFGWRTIGSVLGTSGEAARQRYGRQTVPGARNS